MSGKWLQKIAALLLLGGLTGCGRSDVVKVAGTLTYKGKPVPNCTIFFDPSEGRQSFGVTDAEGRFRLIYDPEHDGAEIDKHRVWVMNRADGPEPGMPARLSKEMDEFYKRYNQANSRVSIEITKAVTDLKLDLD